MTTETLPRPFGNYVLTAELGEDALGRSYRAIRKSEGRPFVRLRLLESPELAADALLDAIDQNGEVHEFLKNAAIARGVEMDAVDGVPYIAWNEPNGRTLDTVIARCRGTELPIPVEHALLIAERVATALDHAYNTTVEGAPTLHGLVWPGLVTLSDDGETRLSGFGLAPGVLPAIASPRLSREIAPYLARDESDQASIAATSDVFSVGVILLELLTGQPPAPDPFAVVHGAPGAPPPPVPPEVLSVLKKALAPAGSRHASSGELRRELGKLLFSGFHSASTFNLAYFLNELFRDEIEAETRARKREASPEAPTAPPAGRTTAPVVPAAPAPARPSRAPWAAPAAEPPPVETAARQAAAPRRGPLAVVGGLIAAAAIAGGVYVISRRSPAPAPRAPAAVPTMTATPPPEPTPTPAASTSTMSEAAFRSEVARQVGLALKKLEREAPPTAPPKAAPSPKREVVEPAAAPPPTAAPTAVPVEIAPQAPAPTPARAAVREGALVAIDEVDSPPRISKIVKPTYPPLALQARIGGTVLLRVLVSETGMPLQVEVVRPGRAGLTESAVSAVRNWTFQPAMKDGVAVKTWIAVPIPFEP